MLTWGELYALFDDYCVAGSPLAVLLVAIIAGDYGLAKEAMLKLTTKEEEKP